MNIIDDAKRELNLINFGETGSQVMIEILEKFFEEWDSGGAVYFAAPVLQKLIAGKPLSPLTGNDDEWVEYRSGFFQNNRCSTVFKERKETASGISWVAHDIDTPGRPAITFPYTPKSFEVRSPLIELNEA